MKRDEIEEKELKFLAAKYKKYPHLFKRETFNDNSKFLEKFGIFIKDKENLPLGYLKLWPQDFIVEEIPRYGEIQTVEMGNFFDKKKVFSKKDLTIYTTLVKCDLSTIEAIEELTSFLKIEKNKIQFAGIKDKDAFTSQLISCRKTNIDDLKKINSPYFFLKDIYSGKGAIEIGGLRGNQFTVLVRTNDFFQEEKFSANLKNIEKQGFYNFYYLQRFGTPRLINFYWGLFILRGEYEKAVLSFLCSPGLREFLYLQKLREEIKERFGNWRKIEKILEPFPLIFQNERKIINYLKKYPKDFIGALNQIPKQIRLWLSAYNSYLFNKKLSSYLKKGVEPPSKIPLILSQDRKDWLFYQKFLKENKIFSMPLKNIKPFPYIRWRKREIQTKVRAEIHQIKIIPEGVVLNFTLPKGIYATTFFAHLFNLSSGLPPKNVSSLPIDTKSALGKKSLKEVLNKFKDVIYPKTESLFEKFE